MNIEIKNFYPVEQNEEKLRGSLHIAIKLGRYELDIRGIYACRKQDHWVFRLPFGKGICPNTGNPVSFPSISFSDKLLNKALIDAIRDKAPSFIEGKDNLIIQSQEAKKTSCDIKPLSEIKIATAVKKQALVEKSNLRHNLPSREWVDVPPPKRSFRKKQVSRG